MKVERILFWAFLFYIFTDAADIATSVICGHYAPWGHEGNPLLQSETGIFPWKRALALKGCFLLLFIVPATLFLQKAFRNTMISSFPLWMNGLNTMNTVVGNLVVLAWPWLQKIS